MSTLTFCPLCENMMYYTTNLGDSATDDSLYNQCRNCSTKIKVEFAEVQTQNIDKANLMKEQYIANRFIHFDPTIPRVNIPCPRVDCKGEVSLLIEYDENNRSTIYRCETCHKWHE